MVGREREGRDLSKVMLTHYTLKNLGQAINALNEGENPSRSRKWVAVAARRSRKLF